MTTMPNTRISGPLAPYIGGVWSHLLAQGYTPLTGGNMLRLVSHLSRWLVDKAVRLSDLTREHVEVFFGERRRAVRWTPFSRPKWGLAKVEPAGLNSSS